MDWPFLERDGYRLVFEPRPSGLSHMDKPGPPSWVRSESVVKPGLDGGLADVLRSSDRPVPWVVDSGASHHAMSE
eukprot:12793428-Alexandrium_andersonii.AAC.1